MLRLKQFIRRLVDKINFTKKVKMLDKMVRERDGALSFTSKQLKTERAAAQRYLNDLSVAEIKLQDQYAKIDRIRELLLKPLSKGRMDANMASAKARILLEDLTKKEPVKPESNIFPLV